MRVRTISFNTQEDAMTVLNQLKQMINRYGQVTLSQYYNLCDFKIDDADTDIYGWRSLGTALIDRMPHPLKLEGYQYIISFPPVENLDTKEYYKTENVTVKKLYNCSNCAYSDKRGNIGGPCMDCITNDQPYTQPTKWASSPAKNTTASQISRDDILDKAKSIINGARQGTYGSPEDSFKVIADFWSAYLNRVLTSHDVANMMILLKVARNAGGVYKDDNWIDICGYAAIGGEIQGRCTQEDN